MNEAEFFIYLSPLVVIVVAYFKGSFYRRKVIDKKRLLKNQLLGSLWVSYIFNVFLFYEDFEIYKDVFLNTFLLDILLSGCVILFLRTFKNEDIF